MVERRRATIGQVEMLTAKVALLEREVLNKLYEQRSLREEVEELQTECNAHCDRIVELEEKVSSSLGEVAS